jgi:pimeloyl-ACP methyl ester carboxylesterase
VKAFSETDFTEDLKKITVPMLVMHSKGIVQGSGHWIMEENPQATTKLTADFLSK